MNSQPTLAAILRDQWQQIRGLTYDYLDMLETAQLELCLPFPESKSLGYQFWCMVGAHESYLRKLEHGAWQGFASSLDRFQEVTPVVVKQQMQQADERMNHLLTTIDLNQRLANGEHAYAIVFQMIKHEMHHHGQLINFMFCHHLPIPVSWRDEWALAYDDDA